MANRFGGQQLDPDEEDQGLSRFGGEPLAPEAPVSNRFGGEPLVPEEESILDKARDVGSAVVSGLEGVIPQFKQQIGGLFSQYEPISKGEYEKLDPTQLSMIVEGGAADTYENFVKSFKQANPIKTFLAEKGAELVESAKLSVPKTQLKRGTPEYYAEAVTSSIANMVPMLAVSILGRRPDIGLGIMLAQVKGGAYQQGRDEGLTTQEAGEYSTLTTIAEVIPSAFPLAKIMKPSGKYLKDILVAGATESAQETVTAALQSGIDKGYINPDMTWGEAVDRMIDGAIIGGAAGAGISAATSPIAKKLQSEDNLEKAFDEALEVPQLEDSRQAAIAALSPDKAQLEVLSKDPGQIVDDLVVTTNIIDGAETVDQAINASNIIIDSEIGDKKVVDDLTVKISDEEIAIQKEVETIQTARARVAEQDREQALKKPQDALISDLVLSKELPQFKAGADVEGVVEPLGGKFDPTGVGPIQVWVRKDGTKEVITGRHRLDLAKRSGEKTISAQYHYESEGFDLKQARALDATLNIREGQGQVKDYVSFIKDTEMTEQQAEAEGIVARGTGKKAFAIASTGSEVLIAVHSADIISDAAAAKIAQAAPNNEALQVVGIKAIEEGKSVVFAENLMKSVSSMTTETQQETGDLFGFDDSAMVEAENLARLASKKQSEIQRSLSAIQGASKRPELAAKEGVDIKDPDAVKKRIAELKAKKTAWANWHTDPTLVAELKGEVKPVQEPVQKPEKIRAYHGTGSKFEVFDESKKGTFTGAESAKKGFFFTSDKGLANQFQAEAERKTVDIKGVQSDIAALSPEKIQSLYEEIGLEDVIPFDSGDVQQAASDIVTTLEEDLGTDVLEERTNVVEVVKKYVSADRFHKGETKQVDLELNNPLVVKFDPEAELDEGAINRAINEAEKKGHDGVIFRDMKDAAIVDEKGGGAITSDVYFVFKPEQIAPEQVKKPTNPKRDAYNASLKKGEKASDKGYAEFIKQMRKDYTEAGKLAPEGTITNEKDFTQFVQGKAGQSVPLNEIKLTRKIIGKDGKVKAAQAKADVVLRQTRKKRDVALKLLRCIQ